MRLDAFSRKCESNICKAKIHRPVHKLKHKVFKFSWCWAHLSFHLKITQNNKRCTKTLYLFMKPWRKKGEKKEAKITSVKSVLSCRADEQSTKGTRVTNVAMNWNVIYTDRDNVQIRCTPPKIQQADITNSGSLPCTCWSRLGRLLVEPSWEGATCEWAHQRTSGHLTQGFVPHRSCSSEWLSADGVLLESPEQGMFYDRGRALLVTWNNPNTWPCLLLKVEN